MKGRLKSETLGPTIVCALCMRGKGLYRKKLCINLGKGKKKLVRHNQYKREPEIVLPFCPRLLCVVGRCNAQKPTHLMKQKVAFVIRFAVGVL